MSEQNMNNTVDKHVNEIRRLRESVVKASLENLDWPQLKTHLDDIDFDEATLELLLGHLRRTNSLIMPYPNKNRESSRTTFLNLLHSYISNTLIGTAANLLSQEISLLDKIEQGYRGILDVLDKCAISRLPPEVRIAACIKRSTEQYTHLMAKYWESFRARKEVGFPMGQVVLNEGDSPLSTDAVIAGLVESLTITIIMEAYKNKWLDTEGFVVLPPLPEVNEDDQYKAGSIELLALSWRAWRRTEERRRFLGGEFEELSAPDFPSGVPENVQSVTIYHPSEKEIFDHVANERLQVRLVQTFLDMMIETNMESKATGIDNGGPLIPGAFVSTDEVHASISLSEILGYSVSDDDDQPGGLRFVEWLRGYAVLKELAISHSGVNSSVARLDFTVALDELRILLEKCGLDRDKASYFINAVTLKASSSDLFDCPLVRMADGKLMVFAPALINANLSRVILSAISSLGEPLERKGKAFERNILSFFKEKGLQAEAIKFRRDEEEYEFDVVLNWGNYVFIFECKNHGLSNNRPIHAYYSALTLKSDGKQVSRLAGALRRYPDVLRDKFGIEVVTKTIVPCVLNALPYSIPGPVDGIYFTDASALKRFFQERYFHIKTPHLIKKNTTIIHRTATHSLWTSDQPSPEDLVKHLELSFQLKLELAHTEIANVPFSLDGKIIVTGEYSSKDKTIESISDLVGISAKSVRKEMADVNDQVKKLKKKHGTKKNKRKRSKKRK